MAELAGESFTGGDMLRLAVESQTAERFTNLPKGGELPIDDILTIYNYPVRQATYFAQNCLASSSPYGCCYGITSTSDSRLSACLSGDNTNETTYSSSEEEILSNQDLTLDKDEIARDLLLSRSEGHDRETSVSDLITVLDMRGTQQDLDCLDAASSQNRMQATAVNSACSPVAEADDDSSDEDDSENFSNDYDDGSQKTVPVGPEYQAQLPELVTGGRGVSALAGSGIDEHLLWDPSKLPEDITEAYCAEVARHDQQTGGYRGGYREETMRSTTVRVKDNEQALYLLLQCGYDTAEALRRHYMQILPPADPLSLWSSEEYTNFVNGLRLYGKDFYLIQQHKVKTRSVAELVHFYYLWKKTDQYAAFNSKNLSDSKKKANTVPASFTTTSLVSETMHTAVALASDVKCHGALDDASAGSLYPVSGSATSWLPQSDSSILVNYTRSQHPADPFNTASVYSNICLPADQANIHFNGVNFASPSASSYTDGFLDPSCYCSPYHTDVASSHLDYFGMDNLDPVPYKKFCPGLSSSSCQGSHMISSADFQGPSLRGSFEYSSASAVGSSSLQFGHLGCQCAAASDIVEQSSLNCAELAESSSYLYSDNKMISK